jgi:hypothetical protein
MSSMGISPDGGGGHARRDRPENESRQAHREPGLGKAYAPQEGGADRVGENDEIPAAVMGGMQAGSGRRDVTFARMLRKWIVLA